MNLTLTSSHLAPKREWTPQVYGTWYYQISNVKGGGGEGLDALSGIAFSLNTLLVFVLLKNLELYLLELQRLL